jgi:hypothetical protein
MKTDKELRSIARRLRSLASSIPSVPDTVASTLIAIAGDVDPQSAPTLPLADWWTHDTILLDWWNHYRELAHTLETDPSHQMHLALIMFGTCVLNNWHTLVSDGIPGCHDR